MVTTFTLSLVQDFEAGHNIELLCDKTGGYSNEK